MPLTVHCVRAKQVSSAVSPPPERVSEGCWVDYCETAFGYRAGRLCRCTDQSLAVDVCPPIGSPFI